MVCLRCGREWPKDPRLAVPCPTCFVKAGRPCKRPSGHAGGWIECHVEREQAALDGGFLDRCPEADRPSPGQIRLF
jgi:hypothetical protein